MRKLLISVFVGAGLLTSGVVFAQADAEKTRAKKRNEIVMPKVIVKGTRQAPQAFYLLQRSAVSAKLKLKKSFVPKIVSSVDRPEF